MGDAARDAKPRPLPPGHGPTAGSCSQEPGAVQPLCSLHSIQHPPTRESAFPIVPSFAYTPFLSSTSPLSLLGQTKPTSTSSFQCQQQKFPFDLPPPFSYRPVSPTPHLHLCLSPPFLGSILISLSPSHSRGQRRALSAQPMRPLGSI